MRLGKIVSSRSHLDYVCQVYQAHEVTEPPEPSDYAFGRFVALHGDAVGIVFDSQLQNPDFGNVGPRLSTSPAETHVFTPDLVHERATLVSVLVLGWLEGAHGVQGVPREIVPVHTEVSPLAPGAFQAFHRDPGGVLQVRYLPLMQSHGGPASASLALSALDQLQAAIPEERARLGVLRNALNWQRTVALVRA